MVFTTGRTTAWWRHVAASIAGASETVVVGELPEADVDITAALAKRVSARGAAVIALNELGERDCEEIIRRCRLLRIIDRDLALRMIGAMWRVIQDLLEEQKPDAFACFVVDRYVLDLFDRALRERGATYVGIAAGILPETLMFMSRGEYLPVREPLPEEVDAAVSALSARDFVPTNAWVRRFGLRQFLGTYVRTNARSLAFGLLRRLRRKSWDFRYLVARYAETGARVRLRDRRITRVIADDWRDRLEKVPFDRRVFVALPVTPEASIDYWIGDLDLVDYATAFEKVARALGSAGFGLFVKDHPAHFGFRQMDFIRRLERCPGVTFVPYGVPARELIELCKSTFTLTGTVGFEAAFAGRCAVVHAGAYYAADGLFVGINGLDDVSRLPERIDAFAPAGDLASRRRTLAERLLRSSVPAAYSSWRGFSERDPKAVASASSVGEAIDRYLPTILEAARVPIPGSDTP
jgi:hypothetical protein